ncbi:MAG: DNA-binding protein [Clostridia bacterium]|nr:DNA-binding protein [Clostridia bacterium]
MEEKKYWTVEEAAAYLRVTVRKLKYEIPEIPYNKIGRVRQYQQKDLDNYMNKTRHYDSIDIKDTKIRYVV